jgi:hypothetical protein
MHDYPLKEELIESQEVRVGTESPDKVIPWEVGREQALQISRYALREQIVTGVEHSWDADMITHLTFVFGDVCCPPSHRYSCDPEEEVAIGGQLTAVHFGTSKMAFKWGNSLKSFPLNALLFTWEIGGKSEVKQVQDEVYPKKIDLTKNEYVVGAKVDVRGDVPIFVTFLVFRDQAN